MTAVAAGAYLAGYWSDKYRPSAALPGEGWWGWSDQSLYLRSALAWASGNLDPAEHWYLPGYPLLGAPFVHVTPANPFLLPDLALMLLSLWLTAALAARLAPGWRLGRTAGGATFLATSVLHPLSLDAWVTPWTTTPATALTLGCLLATLAFVERPAWRPALAASLCASAVAAFRPSDAVVLSGVAGGVIFVRMLTAWPGARAAARCVGAGVLGGAAVLGGVAALHVAVHGWAPGGYILGSRALGFEWRLIPLHWVMLVLDPRPLLPENPGLVGRFPFVATGLAGIVASLVAPPFGGSRARNAFVAAAMAAHVAEYMAYRDLHPQGLWRHLNYHYFKWTIPLFGWYSVMLAASVLRRPVAAAAGCLAAAALLAWRVQLVEVGPAEAPGPGVALPAGMTVQDALLVPAEGGFDAIHLGAHRFSFGGGAIRFGPAGRFAAYPIPGGLLLAPLAPPPAGPGEVALDSRVSPSAVDPPRRVRQAIVPGAPCWLPRWLPRWLGRPAACAYVSPIAPP